MFGSENNLLCWIAIALCICGLCGAFGTNGCGNGCDNCGGSGTGCGGCLGGCNPCR